MDQDQTQKLKLKKKQAQDRVSIANKAAFLQHWWLEWLKRVNQKHSWELVYLDITAEDLVTFWQTILAQPAWQILKSKKNILHIGPQSPVHHLLFEKHPGVLPLRYLPDAPVLKTNEEPATFFSYIVKQNQLAPQLVYVFFVRMSPVVQMDLYDLMNTTHSDEIFPDEEDIVIMSLDGNWIIFKSLEQEWVYRNSLEIQ